jgi:hypothetical protein
VYREFAVIMNEIWTLFTLDAAVGELPLPPSAIVVIGGSDLVLQSKVKTQKRSTVIYNC